MVPDRPVIFSAHDQVRVRVSVVAEAVAVGDRYGRGDPIHTYILDENQLFFSPRKGGHRRIRPGVHMGAGILDLAIGTRFDDAARAKFFEEFGIFRIVLIFRFLFGIEMVKEFYCWIVGASYLL